MLSARALETQLEKLRLLEDRLTFRLSILSKMLDQEASHMLEGTSMNLTAYRVLNVVDTFGTNSISEISRFCMLDRAQASRTAVDLEKKGWIKSQDDPDSKRKKNVVLTDAGRAVLEAVRPKFIERNERFDKALGPERRAVVMDAIRILMEEAGA